MEAVVDFKSALAHQTAGRLAEAEAAYRAIVAQTDHLLSLHNLGVILEATGRFDEAGAVYRRAAEAAPGDVKRQVALANHYRMSRQFAAAEPVYWQAISLAPDNDTIAFDLSLVLLALGRYSEGWALHERREPRLRMLSQGLSFREWKGEPLAGKRLLVWREQGFGDQIMMARFLPMLAGAEVTYMGPPAVRRLFEHLPIRFVEASPGQNEIGNYDYWSQPYSLPQHLRIGARSLPAEPYLFGRPRPAGGRIGVMWQGEPRNANNGFRSLPQAQAERLLALPGAISLDPAQTGARDFQDTADIIAGLDLVITVDTAMAHLAGAMGRPVWVMLAKHAIDWQWPRQGASAWYPSARLFSQSVAGDWAPVVETVCHEVQHLAPT